MQLHAVVPVAAVSANWVMLLLTRLGLGARDLDDAK